jgi:hypothetical protein
MYNLQKGQAVTVYLINNFAMSIRKEIIVDHETEKDIVFKLPKKRKLFQFSKESIELILHGVYPNYPKVDSDEAFCFRGNACLNLVSDKTNIEVRSIIEENCVIPITDKKKSRMLLYTEEQASFSEYEENYDNVLYPEYSFSHAVIDRAKQNKMRY